MEVMFYVSSEISHIPGVIDKFPHKDLATQGRWSIMTDTTHFKEVTAALDTNLASWTRLYCKQENIILGPLIAFLTKSSSKHHHTLPTQTSTEYTHLKPTS